MRWGLGVKWNALVLNLIGYAIISHSLCLEILIGKLVTQT